MRSRAFFSEHYIIIRARTQAGLATSDPRPVVSHSDPVAEERGGGDGRHSIMLPLHGIDLDVVGGVPAPKTVLFCLKKHFNGLSELFKSEFGRKLVFERSHFLLPSRDKSGRQHGEFPCDCTLAGGIGKDVHIRKLHLFAKRHARLERLIALRGIADDDVGGDGGIREAGADERDLFGVLARGVVTVHVFEHSVVAALQREVEVGAKTLYPRRGVQKLFVYDARFQRPEPYAQRSALQRGEKVGKRGADVLAVGGEVYARKHDFLAGSLGGLDLSQHAAERTGSAPAPEIRHYAVGTEVVAPVLHLDKVPGAHGESAAEVLILRRGVEIRGDDLVEKAVVAALPVLFDELLGEGELALGARDELHSVPCELAEIVLRRAAADVDLRLGIDPEDACDGLTGLAFRLRGHGAGVDYVDIGAFRRVTDVETAVVQYGAHGVGIVLVDFASERKKCDCGSIGHDRVLPKR